jgi:hypothetical protein
MDASNAWRKNACASRDRNPSCWDESKAADAEIVVVQRDFRDSSEDMLTPTNWRLRTTVALTDIRAE